MRCVCNSSSKQASDTLRSIYSCAWMFFVALLLDYSHAIGPFSLDFWTCAKCFKRKWPGMVYMNARAKR